MRAEAHEPVVGTPTYLLVAGLLLVLTALTVVAARVDLGAWNPTVAVAIAGVKAGLITLYFMHARWSSGLTWIVIVGGVVWLGLLLAGTLDDLVTWGKPKRVRIRSFGCRCRSTNLGTGMETEQQDQHQRDRDPHAYSAAQDRCHPPRAHAACSDRRRPAAASRASAT